MLDKEIVITNDAGERVLKTGMDDVDYYLTQNQLSYPIIFEEGTLTLYKVR
jgi:hypothetical protein